MYAAHMSQNCLRIKKVDLVDQIDVCPIDYSENHVLNVLERVACIEKSIEYENVLYLSWISSKNFSNFSSFLTFFKF